LKKERVYLSKREKLELGFEGRLCLLSDGDLLNEDTGQTIILDNWQRWKLKTLRNKELASAFWSTSVQKA
jgi:hypothetical protein